MTAQIVDTLHEGDGMALVGRVVTLAPADIQPLVSTSGVYTAVSSNSVSVTTNGSGSFALIVHTRDLLAPSTEQFILSSTGLFALRGSFPPGLGTVTIQQLVDNYGWTEA